LAFMVAMAPPVARSPNSKSHTAQKSLRWCVEELEFTKKRADHNFACVARLEATISDMQKRYSEGQTALEDRCNRLEATCKDLSMEVHGLKVERTSELETGLQKALATRLAEADSVRLQLDLVGKRFDQKFAHMEDACASLIAELMQKVVSLTPSLKASEYPEVVKRVGHVPEILRAAKEDEGKSARLRDRASSLQRARLELKEKKAAQQAIARSCSPQSRIRSDYRYGAGTSTASSVVATPRMLRSEGAVSSRSDMAVATPLMSRSEGSVSSRIRLLH